jgi:hypothetical protein
MKRSPIIFLQTVVVLIGIGVFIFLLWEPHLEGRNANATLFAIYFKDPFLAYVYIASIPFFVALYKAFKVLGYAGQNKIFSQTAVNSLRTIKYCAFIMSGAIVAADAYLMIAARKSNDDPAGAIMLGLIATFISIVIGATATVFERILQDSLNTKSKFDR